MKRILLLLSVAVLAIIVAVTAFADSPLELTYHVECDDYVYVAATDTNNYRIEVPGGTVLTIDFFIEADGDFALSTFQNEIYFDPNFFSYMNNSGEIEKEKTACELKKYSNGEMRVFVNSVTDTDMTGKQKIASFKLLVKEDTVGAVSLIETKRPSASDSTGIISAIAEKNLEVKIIAGDANLKKHSVTYKDGDTVLEKFDIIKGQYVLLMENDIKKDGVVFDGWKINGGEVKKPGDKIIVDADVTVEAVWKAKKEYLLHFDTKGGSMIPSIKGYEGDVITIKQTPTRTGFVFEGWFSDTLLKKQVTSVTLNADTTVYAKWTKLTVPGGGIISGGTVSGNDDTKKNTITFKTADGIELGRVTLERDTDVDLSKYKYEKDGYTFFGFYTDKELTSKVTRIVLKEDITLYVRWIKGEIPEKKHPAILTTEHYAYITGRGENKICPQDNITRAEVATIFFRLLTEEVRNENMTKDNVFADVKENDWFNTAVSTLAKLGIVNGRAPDTFAPNANITRAEFTAIVSRFVDGSYKGEHLFKDIDGHWAENYINTAASLGWIVGEKGMFRPNDNITRAEVMTLVNRVLNRVPETKADLINGMTTWVDNTDETAWYYLAVQEATNSHTYKIKADGEHEKWVTLTKNPDWSKLEK